MAGVVAVVGDLGVGAVAGDVALDGGPEGHGDVGVAAGGGAWGAGGMGGGAGVCDGDLA